MTDLRFDIPSLHNAYSAGLTAVEMIETVLSRVAAVDDPGIFIHFATRSDLVAQAAALGPFDPKEKPLWGIPFAVKDNIDVAGMPTTAACVAYAYEPKDDATVVALLKAAGALVIGKTNLDQFAAGLVGVRTPYSIPRNAIDPALVPGGSSSGSAVAVSAGIVSFALGTDTAGSGRIPAGLNNIVGLKPTIGALSTRGVVPACRTLDCVSVFALTVEDAYAVFLAAARPDPTDAYSKPVRAFPLGRRAPVLSVGVPAKAERKFFGDTAMEAGFDKALAMLEALGCRLVDIPFEDFYATAELLYGGAWIAERYAAIERFMDAHEEAMHPVTREIIACARKLSAVDAFKSLYALQAYKARLAPTIGPLDMICVPTAPTHYTVAEVLADPIDTNARLGTYTNFVNLLDQCAIAVPCGNRVDGHPMSVTLLGRAGRDCSISELARDIHGAVETTLGATPWIHDAHHCEPLLPDAGTIELAVVGAHLSGMPLNGQLKDLGARFAFATRTSASYQLYALAGHSVPKPGLIRSENESGTPIEVEVWRFGPAEFGRFVATIPSPLSVGTIELENGASCKGFLVEAVGLHGADDISRFGGWRRYVGDSAIACRASRKS